MFSSYVETHHRFPDIVVSFLEKSSGLIHSCHFVLQDVLVFMMLVTYTEGGLRLSCAEFEGFISNLFVRETTFSYLIEKYFEVSYPLLAWSSCTYKRQRIFRKRSKKIIWSFSGCRLNEALLSLIFLLSSAGTFLTSICTKLQVMYIYNFGSAHNQWDRLSLSAPFRHRKWAFPPPSDTRGFSGPLNSTYDMFASFGRAFQVSCLSRSLEGRWRKKIGHDMIPDRRPFPNILAESPMKRGVRLMSVTKAGETPFEVDLTEISERIRPTLSKKCVFFQSP